MNTSAKDLLRPLALNASLESGYRAMAADKLREAEAQEWGDALNADQNYFRPEEPIQGGHKS
jgi:hypothetical protein